MPDEKEILNRIEEIYNHISKKRAEAQKILDDMTNLCKDAIALQIQLKQINGTGQGKSG